MLLHHCQKSASVPEHFDGPHTICLGIFLVHDRIRVGSYLSGVQVRRSVRSEFEGLGAQSRVQSSPLQVPIEVPIEVPVEVPIDEGHDSDY